MFLWPLKATIGPSTIETSFVSHLTPEKRWQSHRTPKRAERVHLKVDATKGKGARPVEAFGTDKKRPPRKAGATRRGRLTGRGEDFRVAAHFECRGMD